MALIFALIMKMFFVFTFQTTSLLTHPLLKIKLLSVLLVGFQFLRCVGGRIFYEIYVNISKLELRQGLLRRYRNTNISGCSKGITGSQNVIFFLDISVWLLWYDLCLMAIVIEQVALLDDVHCWSTHFARKVSLVVLLKAMNYRKYSNVLSSSLTCRLNIYIYI